MGRSSCITTPYHRKSIEQEGLLGRHQVEDDDDVGDAPAPVFLTDTLNENSPRFKVNTHGLTLERDPSSPKTENWFEHYGTIPPHRLQWED